MSATLATLRARIRTILESAAGFPDPLPVATSSETLTTLRDRVELQLQDSTNLRWATGDIDEAIEKALEEYNKFSPILDVSTVTLAADGREVDISGISDLLHVQKAWWPYDSTDPSYPPNWVQFDVYPGSILFIDEPTEPATGEKVRVWYTTPAEISGLNGASSTTVPAEDMTYILTGACYYAVRTRAAELAESVTVDDKTIARMLEWADDQGKAFRYGIRVDEPAWQRYAYAYDQGDIDEGIRWALGRFNEVAPEETIDSVTLSAAGREVDISSLTDLVRVTRAWWPYTSTSPEYPPNWVPFEQWGTTLFLKTESEPAVSEVVRVFYERLCTINGLDSATSTTIPDDAEDLIVTGAAAMITEERVLEHKGRYAPRQMREWAAARKADFERGLKAHARREAARQAGILALPPMDRWEKRGNDEAW